MAPQRTRIEQTYRQEIPASFRHTQSIVVRLLTDAAMNASVDPNSQDADAGGQDTIDGITQGDPPIILLRASRPTADIEAIFAHEYGHIVWHSVLSAAQRAVYLRVYAVDRDEHHLISEYAEASPEEGFAEAFGEFVLHARRLADVDPRSYAFLSALSNTVHDKNHSASSQSQEWEHRDPAP